jgi:Flp pilus assembly protein TadD
MAKQGKKTTKKKQAAKERTRKKANPLKGYPKWFFNTRLHCGILFALGLLLYANTLGHDYALDDAIVIYDNMYVQEGVSGIPGILSKDTFFGFFKEEGKARLVAGGRYRPLTLILFAIEYQIFGDQPFVGHLFNGLFYGLTIMVLYLLTLMLFKEKGNKPGAYFIALATAIIFAVLPVHTEVVANIKGRDEIIALLGSLAALYYSLRAYKEKVMKWSIIAGLLFFLALMAKENAITYLAIVPLAYYFFIGAEGSKIIRQLVPFAVATVVFLAIRYAVLGLNVGDATMEMMNNPFVKVQGNQYVAFTVAERLSTIVFGLGKYLQLLIAPIVLSHDYYPRQIGVMSFGDWQVWLSILVYIGLLVYAIRQLPRKDPLSFAILYFLATISIVSNIVFPVGTHIAERLIFMPSVGYALALGVLGYRLAAKKTAVGKAPSYRRFRIPLIALVAIGLVYGGRTITRNPVWKDNYTLFLTDIENSPNSAKLRNAVGGELLTQSVNETNPAQQTKMWEDAVGHLNEAIKIHPNYKNAYLLLGNAYNYLKRYEESIASFKKALEIDPAYRDARRNLGITYKDAGKYYGETKNDLNTAIRYLNQAYEMLPEEYEVLRLLGVAHGVKGNGLEAVEYFTLAANANPDDPQAWLNLGTAHLAIGNTAIGQQHRARAYEMDPSLKVKVEQPIQQGQ